MIRLSPAPALVWEGACGEGEEGGGKGKKKGISAPVFRGQEVGGEQSPPASAFSG